MTTADPPANPPAGSSRVVLRGCAIYAPSTPFATAVICAEGRIAWLGDNEAVDAHLEPGDAIIDCADLAEADQYVVACPAFVDGDRQVTGPPHPGVVLWWDATEPSPRWHSTLPEVLPETSLLPVGRTPGESVRLLDISDLDRVPLREYGRDGIAYCYGSGTSGASPWEWIFAASSRGRAPVTVRAAFAAATRSGWRRFGGSGTGSVEVGALAAIGVWVCRMVDVAAPDERIARWSTDPRSGTPQLPVLTDSEGRFSPPHLAGSVIGTRWESSRPS